AKVPRSMPSSKSVASSPAHAETGRLGPLLPALDPPQAASPSAVHATRAAKSFRWACEWCGMESLEYSAPAQRFFTTCAREFVRVRAKGWIRMRRTGRAFVASIVLGVALVAPGSLGCGGSQTQSQYDVLKIPDERTAVQWIAKAFHKEGFDVEG